MAAAVSPQNTDRTDLPTRPPSDMPQLSIIAAVARNRVIGRDDGLPWRLSRDLRRFKRLTMGKSIIMGRQTFDSIGRLLPGRQTIVLTRQGDWQFAGATACHSLTEALAAEHPDGSEVFVIGGATLYAVALPIAERLYLTHVEADVAGDTFFPPWSDRQWQATQRESFPADEHNEYATTFVVYERIHPRIRAAE